MKSDQREFERVHFKIHIKFKFENNRSIMAMVDNISLKGLAISSSEQPMTINQEYPFELGFSQAQPPIQGKGLIIRSNSLGEYAMKITYLSLQDFEKIYQLTRFHTQNLKKIKSIIENISKDTKPA